MNKLLKDAIADAKAVRETALANAKLALEEAFSPKLQSMLSSKIREAMEEEEPETAPAEDEATENRMKELAGIYEEDDEMPAEEEGGEEDYSDEDMGGDDMEDMGGQDDMEDMGGEEDFSDEGGEEDYEEEPSADDEDLEEILRELEDEESTDEESMMEGPYGMGAAQDPDASEEENAFWQMMNSLEEGMSDAEAVKVLKAAKKDPKFMDKLKQAFNEAEGSDEEEMDVNEVIRQLREEDSEESEEEKMDEEIDLNELLNSLNEEEGEEEEKEETKMEGKKNKMKMKKMEEELNEAYSAVKYLRSKLSEVNLLNAKLLYVNKLFRNNLTETQKVKVIENFDRAKTVREAKLVYATLSESFKAAKASTTKTTTKKSVMEGFASKATKKTNSVLNEGNDQINRFKKLAGII